MEDCIQIGDRYRITSDRKYNLILNERYEKMDSKGRNGKPTGEIGYRPIGYYRKLEHIGKSLVEKEVYENIGDGLSEAIVKISELEKSIIKAMNDVNVSWIK